MHALKVHCEMYFKTLIEVHSASVKDSKEAPFSVFVSYVHFVELLYKIHLFHLISHCWVCIKLGQLCFFVIIRDHK